MIGGVTLLDVARKVGCDKSTVSRALRGHSGVDPRTAERIRAISNAMGYRPDPVQVMAAERRWKPGSQIGSHTVAFILPSDPDDAREGGHRVRSAQQSAEWARKRLEELGCQLEVFRVSEYTQPGPLARVLQSRGIRAVMVPQIPRESQIYFEDFPWQLFTGVGLRMGWALPPVHMVDNDEHYGVQKAFRVLSSRGYTRIGAGLAAHQPWAEDDYSRHGAFTAELENAGRPQRRLPIYSGTARDRTAFLDWFKKHKPDAIIGFHTGMLHWLKEAGLCVPGEVGFAALHTDRRTPEIAGLVVEHEQVVRACVELLVLQIRSNLWGVPSLRQRILIEPAWQEGETLRAAAAIQ